tara:strand:+ start:16006 stop:17076 length:1071 start_codon:yes stop_codon:yes gene_type:complete
MDKYLVTGGAGFIGSSVIRNLLNHGDCEVLNIDDLTYAGNLENLLSVESNQNYHFKKVNINDFEKTETIIEDYQPDFIMHLAAESHVDRSIDDPSTFIQTNIIGTFNLLEATRKYLGLISKNKARKFRFHHISTDEVFGSLGEKGFFDEDTKYDPSSPYSSSKASSDHLVRAWYRTYDLPVVITNCSNNYGPFQFPEKLIPLMIINALNHKPLPIYGDGLQIRDWLYVDDHADALIKSIREGNIGETYNIGGNCEKTNKELVNLICEILSDIMVNDQRAYEFKNLIEFVDDRPGHDQRYAIDNTKIMSNLGWKPKETIETGLEKTIIWYLENKQWYENIIKNKYSGHRLGVIKEKI